MPTSSDLVVETGDGLLDANSYLSIPDADTYHALRGNTLWDAASTSDKVIALVRATAYIDQRWKFQSVVSSDAQALEFPRSAIYDSREVDQSDTVPNWIEDATAEYALAVIGEGTGVVDLYPTPDQATSLNVTYERNKVDVIEQETHYDASVGPRVRFSYPAADRIIRASGLTTSTSNGGVIR